MLWSAAGVAAGGSAAALATHALAGILYGIGPTDPLTYAAAGASTCALAAIGSALAARRATAIDPLDALRV